MINDKNKKIRIRFSLLNWLGITILVSFFVYGIHFDIFGKKFEDVDPLFVKLHYVVIIIFVLYMYIYYRFLKKNWGKLDKPKKNKQR
ncbi:MAG: hypothetical protein FD122_2698 [Stygiobacter sp.]|nr:MAG: hypothetical protein FD122_2698 [Stygiobacter sp.]KAF0217387.1 MAG: hypothetical protein FD178_587 [Ignavibacteria bacterium]